MSLDYNLLLEQRLKSDKEKLLQKRPEGFDSSVSLYREYMTDKIKSAFELNAKCKSHLGVDHVFSMNSLENRQVKDKEKMFFISILMVSPYVRSYWQTEWLFELLKLLKIDMQRYTISNFLTSLETRGLLIRYNDRVSGNKGNGKYSYFKLSEDFYNNLSNMFESSKEDQTSWRKFLQKTIQEVYNNPRKQIQKKTKTK